MNLTVQNFSSVLDPNIFPKISSKYSRFHIFGGSTSVLILSWAMTRCRSCLYSRHFGDNYCLHYQDEVSIVENDGNSFLASKMQIIMTSENIVSPTFYFDTTRKQYILLFMVVLEAERPCCMAYGHKNMR
jgi:hypothetical protein